MFDQANQLRALVRESAQSNLHSGFPLPRKLVVSGGKGGVGSTTVALNVAVALAQQGRRIVLVDGDMQRADIASLCRLEVRDTINDVLAARRTVHEVLQRGPAGIQVLPGCWSPNTVPDCSPAAQERLLRELDRLGRHADIVIIDAGSGLNQVVKRFWEAADLVLLTTTSDSLSIMDAYAAIKVLLADRAEAPVQTLVNMANEAAAEQVHARIAQACQRFLSRTIESAGHLPFDRDVAGAANVGMPLQIQAPDCAAAVAIEAVAQRLLDDPRLKNTTRRLRVELAVA